MRQIETKLNWIPYSAPSAVNSFYTRSVQQLPWEVVVVTKMKASERRKGYGLKRILVSQHNYLTLKRLGQAGDSFNDVITYLLLIERNHRQEKEKQQERDDDHNSNGSSISESYSSNFISEAIEQDNQRIAKLIRMHEEEQKQEQREQSSNNNKARKK